MNSRELQLAEDTWALVVQLCCMLFRTDSSDFCDPAILLGEMFRVVVSHIKIDSNHL